MQEPTPTIYPNQKTAERVLQDILWRYNEIEQMQKTINELVDYAKGLPDYEEYRDSIESYKN
ncbi:hypothetical protein KBC79_01455 [Candidatus Woesebacteria bacterium]|nr:hypothetical protein [Candidatus Woesebacteria bacterium]